MKFTLSWLKSHLQTEATLDEILEALTDLGLEVEGVENPADKLAAFTLAKVRQAEQHPDADRLRVCVVETDEGDKQIVCGAPNARAGITVVLAKPGDYVPGIDVTLSVGKIRGVESHGMMASERELELSDEHTGIIELPSGEVGQSFADWLAQNDPAKVDPVIEIAITPNRPDALGVRGIARDLAARGLGTLKPRETTPVPGSFDCPIDVTIDPDTQASACPVFYGRVIRGVKNGPSPDWLQDLLRAIGLRPISALVDITNFFTYDMNRPLHVFDADKVRGGLRVHAAAGGETLTALDEKDYVLQPGMTVISDDAGVESIGGVMGGLHSGCTEDTVNVFLEAAYFDPIRTAMTGRALKINSDARYRFERGIDPAWTPEGIEHATRMILDLCGGEASEVVKAGEIPDLSRAYRLDTDRVTSLVGMDIPAEQQRATLEALGFTLEGDMATPPTWRPDVLGEADLVEEVARVASLTKLRGKPMPRAQVGVPRPILTPMQRREQAARRTVAGLGYNECVTYSFIDKASATLFGGGDDATMLENPISSEMSHMRPDLLPGLLQAAARNQARGFADLALFEVGPTFHGGEPADRPHRAQGRPRRAPRGGPLRRQGRCRGGACRDRRAGQGADPARGRGLVASRPPRQDLPRPEKGLGRVRRNPSQDPAADGREGAGGGLHPLPRRAALPAQILGHPAGAGTARPSGGRARLRLRRGPRGRGADLGQRRCRRRQEADRGCPRLRRIHRRQPWRRQEVAGHHRADAAQRPDPDRGRDRGRGRAHRRKGAEGDRRHPARLGGL